MNKYIMSRVTTSALVHTGKCWLMAVQLNGGSDASSLQIHSSEDGSGTQVWDMVAPFTDSDASAQSTVYISFADIGGIKLSTHLYATLAGTGAVAYVWYQAE